MNKFSKRKKRYFMIQELLRKNVAKLMSDKHLLGKDLAGIMEVDTAQVSRILSGKNYFTLAHIEKISTSLDLRPIDIFTYPDVYIKENSEGTSPAEVLVQLRLTKEKKDQVLKLVFGEKYIEILNK